MFEIQIYYIFLRSKKELVCKIFCLTIKTTGIILNFIEADQRLFDKLLMI